MQKPQYKRENGLLVKQYPEFISELEASVTDGMNNVKKEELEQLCDAIYRSGYMDGFNAGAYFNDGL